jgi:hypothetical protein
MVIEDLLLNLPESELPTGPLSRGARYSNDQPLTMVMG